MCVCVCVCVPAVIYQSRSKRPLRTVMSGLKTPSWCWVTRGATSPCPSTRSEVTSFFFFDCIVYSRSPPLPPFISGLRSCCVPSTRSTKRSKRSWTGTPPTRPSPRYSSLRNSPAWKRSKGTWSTSLAPDGGSGSSFLEPRTDTYSDYDRWRRGPQSCLFVPVNVQHGPVMTQPCINIHDCSKVWGHSNNLLFSMKSLTFIYYMNRKYSQDIDKFRNNYFYL